MEYHRPTTVDEAIAVKAADPEAQYLAGGTDLMVEVNLAHHRPSSVIDVRHIAELGAQTENRIGAAVTWAELETSPDRALADLSRTVGSPQIRAAGTIGGNVATASPAGDGLPWIAAMNGAIEVAGPKGRRLVPWNDFFTGVKQTSLAPDELITAVVTDGSRPVSQHFAKIGIRSAMVISTVSCVVAKDEDGFRVALGSVAPTVVRAHQTELLLNSEPSPTEATLSEVANTLSGEIAPITDHRSTEAYRRHAAGVLVTRLARRCLR